MFKWKEILPQRHKNSNKGTYGTLLVIGGSFGMAGAAYLCALAAYRTGVGLVKIYTEEANRTILQTLLPEAILLLEEKVSVEDALSGVDAVVIGPGLGVKETSVNKVKSVCANSKVPVLFDADALNIFAGASDFHLSEYEGAYCLTPHVGEMARLSGKSISDIKQTLKSTALSYAEEQHAVVVLKDYQTCIADPSGKIYMDEFGCTALAKGGSGDVLSGVIGALLAQGVSTYEAAALGVYIHGNAGKKAAGHYSEYSVLAHETADNISEVIKEILT